MEKRLLWTGANLLFGSDSVSVIELEFIPSERNPEMAKESCSKNCPLQSHKTSDGFHSENPGGRYKTRTCDLLRVKQAL